MTKMKWKRRKMTNKLNQKGYSHVLLVLALVVIAVAAALYFGREDLLKPSTYTGKVKEITEDKMMKKEGFEELEEPEGTPDELGNDVLDELDALILELDSTNEDISDL